jgi:hypothetical protein
MIPNADNYLLGFLNSKAAWFQWLRQTPIASGGYIRLKQQYIAPTVLPAANASERKLISKLSASCGTKARRRLEISRAVRHRILDLAPLERARLFSRKMEQWQTLDFAAFRREVKRKFRAEIPLKERNEWEAYLTKNAAEWRRLTSEIEAAEQKIDTIVYRLFDLTADEIQLLERSLATRG